MDRRDPDLIRYRLPDGRVIALAYDLCRAAALVTHTLGDGRVVEAVILPGER